jgi:hypothetical protein
MPTPPDTQDDALRYSRRLMLRLLAQLEDDLMAATADPEFHPSSWLWGKESLISALVKLSGMLLKLPASADAPTEAPPLSEQDAALIQRFLERQGV